MSTVLGTSWRFLVVEDKEDIAAQLVEAVTGFVDAPDSAEGRSCRSFTDAVRLLDIERFDLLILDLKDDSVSGLDEHDVSAGMVVFNALKTTRFVPVVFYTAHAHKVRDMQTSFVRVVEKTEGLGKLKEEVVKIFSTKLPALSRRLEELKRGYLWDFVSSHWQEFDSPHEKADLACLLARRLALTLQQEAAGFAGEVAGGATTIAQGTIHPMEMYVRPPVSASRQAGDIVKGNVGGVDGYWLVVTPSCDFEERHPLNNVLLARCAPLTDAPEFAAWKLNPTGETSGKLKSLIGDNRQKAQAERYKFLPGTFFLTDSVVDFQQLKTVTPEELCALDVIASLDSPFAESVLARFARYYGRLGTPDIDKEVVIARLQAIVSAVVPQNPHPSEN